MPSVFKNFIEIGSVVSVNNGPAKGKIAVIVDVADINKALVDGPESVTGFPRQLMNFKDVSVTGIKVEGVTRGTLSPALAEAVKKQKIVEKYQKSKPYQRLQQQTRRLELTDFERFKVDVLKLQRNRLVNKVYKELKKESAEKRAPKIQKQKKERLRTLARKKILTRLSFSRLARKKQLRSMKKKSATTKQ